MKKIATTIVAVAAVAASAGVASAQTTQPVAPSAFESVVPFAGSGPVFTGRSAYVGGADTSRVYVGPSGEARLAPHINGIF